MPQINIGTTANDGTGDPLRTAFQKVDQYGFLNDKTVNAAFYKTPSITTEAALNLAIPAAAALGTGAAVWTPASMLPYNASLVTFNPAVQMLREGGAPRWLDLQAYGADGGGSGTLSDASWTAVIARGAYLSSRNLGTSMPSTGVTIYAPQGTYYVSATLDITSILAGEVVGDGPRLTRIVTSVTTTAGINACNASTGFTVLRGFTLYQSALAIPGAARAGNYGIRNTASVGFQLLLDEVEVNYFANSGIYIEGPTGPTVISNCSVQYNAGWGLEIAPFGGNGGQNIQVLAGNIHNCWGGIKVSQANGCQFHAADIELGNNALWPCIYLTGAAYGNSFYECTMSVGAAAPALTGPSNGIVVVDNGIANTFINGINTAPNGQSTDNYRLVGTSDRTTVIGGNHTNTAVGGGYFAVVQSTNNVFQNNLVNASTYVAGKNTINEGSGVGNFTIIIGTGTNGPVGTAGTSFGSASLQVGRRIWDGRVQLTSGTTPALDASLGDYFTLNITSNIAVVVAIPSNAPTSGFSQEITIAMRNGSGGALTTPPTFNTGAGGFKFPAGVIVNPANGTQVEYKFRFDDVQVFWYLVAAPATVGY